MVRLSIEGHRFHSYDASEGLKQPLLEKAVLFESVGVTPSARECFIAWRLSDFLKFCTHSLLRHSFPFFCSSTTAQNSPAASFFTCVKSMLDPFFFFPFFFASFVFAHSQTSIYHTKMTSPDSTIATRIGNLHLLFQVKFPATSLLVRVTANTSGGLQMIINNNAHSCTTRRVDQQLWMEHTVLPTDELMTRCVITAASLIAAAYDETSGDELWAVKDGHGNASLQFVPFSIGRQTIGVTDLAGVVGNRVHVEFSTRGRDGVFYTYCTNFSEKQTHRRAIMGSHAASHPLLPCLRELVATALIGLVTFAECKCAWTSPQQGATSVVPTEVVLSELAVPFNVTMPLISLHLCARGE